MKYQYTYTSKPFSTKKGAEQLRTELSPLAQVEIQPSGKGFVVTCGLGDEDELEMLEYAEQRWRWRKKR